MTQTAAAAAAPGLRVCSHGLASGKLDRLRDKGGAGKPAGAGVGPGWSSPHRSDNRQLAQSSLGGSGGSWGRSLGGVVGSGLVLSLWRLSGVGPAGSSPHL